MVIWNKFKDNASTPRDRRLLLITQRSGTSDLGDIDLHDVVVGHWNQHLWGFVIANEPNETPSGAKLIVRYWAELPEMPPVKLRNLDGSSSGNDPFRPQPIAPFARRPSPRFNSACSPSHAAAIVTSRKNAGASTMATCTPAPPCRASAILARLRNGNGARLLSGQPTRRVHQRHRGDVRAGAFGLRARVGRVPRQTHRGRLRSVARASGLHCREILTLRSQ
jgi:hypothetical protein